MGLVYSPISRSLHSNGTTRYNTNISFLFFWYVELVPKVSSHLSVVPCTGPETGYPEERHGSPHSVGWCLELIFAHTLQFISYCHLAIRQHPSTLTVTDIVIVHLFIVSKCVNKQFLLFFSNSHHRKCRDNRQNLNHFLPHPSRFSIHYLIWATDTVAKLITKRNINREIR
jgi:hypothetical protein